MNSTSAVLGPTLDNPKSAVELRHRESVKTWKDGESSHRDAGSRMGSLELWVTNSVDEQDVDGAVGYQQPMRAPGL